MIQIKTFVFNYFQENTYLIYDETGEAVVIDCGCCNKQEELELSRFITEHQLQLKHVLCTHLHLDHIFGNAFLLNCYGLFPEAGLADVKQLPSPTEQAMAFGLRKEVETAHVRHFLQEGDTIRFGNTELLVKEVPGHSPGSVVFYNPKSQFVIVGDALFAGSIGRTDIWGGDHTTLIRSIRNQLLTLPEQTTVYPGHGGITTIEKEKLNNPYL